MKREITKIFFIVLIFHFQIPLAQGQESESSEFDLEVADTIYSEILEEDRSFWIRFPEGYNPNNHLRYPVIYLLDGYSLKRNLETVYENYWGHYLPHSILIGISNRENRNRDLTTSKVQTRNGGPMSMETGKADSFSGFLENELLPYIDEKYPTTPYRTLIGHSLAGLFTINALLNYRHLFNNYIAIDPSLDWDDQKLLREAIVKLQTEDFTNNSLFVSLAAEQLHMFDASVTIDNVLKDSSEFTSFARSIVKFSNFAESHQQNGLNFSWKIYKEDLHGTVTLPSMRDGLVWLFSWFQFKSPQTYNNPTTSVETIKEMLTKQEEIYTSHFGYKSPPMIAEMLEGYGYMNMQMGDMKKAALFFILYVEHFPKSNRAYDSIIEYYTSLNDSENVLKYARMALENNESAENRNRVSQLLKN